MGALLAIYQLAKQAYGTEIGKSLVNLAIQKFAAKLEWSAEQEANFRSNFEDYLDRIDRNELEQARDLAALGRGSEIPGIPPGQ
jgi:aromatic ring hydroxylase